MSTQAFWNQQHDKYSSADWIDKPSLFAQWAINYFPSVGAVLELGAGQAQDSRFFNELGYKVTATDFSERALELARQKSSGRIKFQAANLSKPLAFKDASFEVVYAHLSLHYFDLVMTNELFAEIERVLKPGGILAALFNSTDDPEITEGRVIEPDFMEIGGIQKRYFSPESACKFAKNFKIIVADNKGGTYKDQAIGVNNLVRLIARKP